MRSSFNHNIKMTMPVLWRQILRQNFVKLDQLAEFLELDAMQRQFLAKKSHFSLNVPLRLAKKIVKGSLNDPILRQFLPLAEENVDQKGFVLDPLEDASFRCQPKMLHKYEGRVLLLCTSACAMHCRYCFRQNFDYEVEQKTFQKELALIGQDTSIHEVILSGGDPLSLSDKVLRELLCELSAMPHITRIRFHTRFPIGIPERIDDTFLRIFDGIVPQVWFVIHANHSRELDSEVLTSLKKLQKQGIVVLNQAVLLRGVNDDANTLHDLCELLVNNGILPYYLHQLDRVKGTAHFEVDEEHGRELIREIAKSLPGYAVPKYVREIAGEAHKTLLY